MIRVAVVALPIVSAYLTSRWDQALEDSQAVRDGRVTVRLVFGFLLSLLKRSIGLYMG